MVPVSLLPSEYDTPNVFMLNDIHRLFVKYRRTNGLDTKPRVLLVGRFEYDQIASIAFSVTFTPAFIARATKEDYYRHSDRFFQDEWAAGRLTIGTDGAPIAARTVDADHHAELI